MGSLQGNQTKILDILFIFPMLRNRVMENRFSKVKSNQNFKYAVHNLDASKSILYFEQ